MRKINITIDTDIESFMTLVQVDNEILFDDKEKNEKCEEFINKIIKLLEEYGK